MSSDIAISSEKLALVYPEVREPYRSVFRAISRGINRSWYGEVEDIVISRNIKHHKLHQLLTSTNPDRIVLLGSGASRLISNINIDIPFIVGAGLFPAKPNTNRLTAISLIPDPEILFRRLHKISPKLNKITVVYNPNNSQWLINRARAVAKVQGYKFNAIRANNLSESATKFRDLFDEMDGETDALWLPRDSSIVDKRAILPLILEKAWDANIAVFSSTPSHAKKGVLFSLLPDNEGMGRALANAVKRSGSDEDLNGKISLLQQTLIVVNLRTAEHLQLRFNRKLRRSFDLVFPKP